VAFSLKSAGKKLFDLSASSLKERFMKLFGLKLGDKLLTIDFKNPYISLTGLVTDASESFSNRNKIHVFVNNRPVMSPVIIHAISQAYRAYIPPNRYPACVLNIGITPDLVDVNVHPSKREVKFVNQQGIHEILAKAIKSRLEETSAKLDMSISDASTPAETNETKKTYTYRNKPSSFRVSEKQSDYLRDIDLSKATKFSFTGSRSPFDDNETHAEASSKTGTIIPRFQWNCKYVVAEDEEGILIIDQHTAWERINYERLQSQFADQQVISQGALIPETIEFERSQSGVLLNNIEMLKQFGIHIEEFGPNIFKITGIPAVAGKTKDDSEVKDLIANIVEVFEETGKIPDITELNDKILKIIACRSSIKAGERMSTDEINSMISLLNECKIPHRCPHGRPVIIRLTEKELDSKFLR
jgi:DNA mismatch repair protein MutL